MHTQLASTVQLPDCYCCEQLGVAADRVPGQGMADDGCNHCALVSTGKQEECTTVVQGCSLVRVVQVNVVTILALHNPFTSRAAGLEDVYCQASSASVLYFT
jgi:hypothetical protein